MNPYVCVLIALFSFASMGIVHKLGDRVQCRPLAIAFHAVLIAGLLSGVRALFGMERIVFSMPPRILLIALPFGLATALALWFFQEGLRYGRIATSWLLINLSAAVPTILSIVFYHEPLGRRKAAVLCLMGCSLLLLWWDRRATDIKVTSMDGGRTT